MSYSSALTTALLNSIRPPAVTLPASILTLAQGQIIQATVQRVAENTVWLDIAGRTITAQTELPLSPRQQVLLSVSDTNPNQITLQLVEQSTTSTATAGQTASTAAASATQTQQLQSMLASWGLEADATNMALAKGLLTHGHTVNPQDIQAARSAWLGLATPTPADLDALAYLKANNLPMGPESVAMARTWLDGMPQIANRITSLQQAMTTTLAQLQQSGGNNPALTALTNTLQSTLSQMANWPITADTPAPEIAGRVASLVVNLGTPPEAQLANMPAVTITASAAGMPQAPQTEQAAIASANGQGASIPIPAEGAAATAETLQGAAKGAAQAEPSIIPNAEKGTAGADNPIRQLASAVNHALSTPNLDEATAQSLRHLANNLNALSNDLGAIHLSNLSNTPNPAANGQYYLFPIPLNTSDGPRTAHLKVYQQPGQKKVDPQNTRLALLLDLPSLGEIAIDLTVFQRQLTGKILSGREQTNTLVELGLAELGENLSALGYRVESLTSDMLSPETTRDLSPVSAQTKPSTLSLTRIDFSV